MRTNIAALSAMLSVPFVALVTLLVESMVTKSGSRKIFEETDVNAHSLIDNLLD